MSTHTPSSLAAILQTPKSFEEWLDTLNVVSPEAPADDGERERRNEALGTLRRTIPAAYQWARFSAPELRERAGIAAAGALCDTVWRFPRLIFVGAAGSGKTSLAVACLRRWVYETTRVAGFFHANELGMARIQHPAGRGEPELVERAKKWPLVLIDDLGSERGIAGCAVPDVIYVRHAEDRPTWLTTGLSRRDIVDRYGAGIARRVFERATVVTLDV
jgi:DNA replication protein DnaC